MPIYVYRCETCKEEYEELKSVKYSDVIPERCPNCGEPSVIKLIGGTAFLGHKQKGYYNSKVAPKHRVKGYEG